MKEWTGILAALGLSLALATTVEGGTIIRWGDVLAADHIAVRMSDRIAEQAGDKTQGRIQIQAYPASQLGSSKEMIEAVVLGTQQMVTEGDWRD